MLNDKIMNQLKTELEKLKSDVNLNVFTQEMECRMCADNRGLMEDVASVSDKIKLEFYDFVSDKEKVNKYNIDKVPASVIAGDKDYGIRFYGIPAGYEFTSLVEVIKMVSARESGLTEETKNKLKQINVPVHIQVFVSLTCPYCASAVRLAHQFAMENENITSDMIDSAEFVHLSNKYNVLAVPKVVINEDTTFEGALPEKQFLEKILKAVGKV